MTKPDPRRVYYDHEPVYRRVAAKGGRGWDDYRPENSGDSYVGVDAFLASEWAPEPGTRALELGCGGGQVALRLARRGYVATGIDFSETAIELAKKNALESNLDVAFYVDDCLYLRTQKDHDFGLVVDNHAYHCIVTADDRRTFLAQVARVLRPGGLYFTETMACDEKWDAVRCDADPVTKVSRHGNRIWIAEAEFDRELDAAGFEILLREHRAQPPEDAPTGPLLVRCARRP